MRDLHGQIAESRRPNEERPDSRPPAKARRSSSAPTPAATATVLTTASSLYDKFRLRRIYYSGVQPHPRRQQHLPSRPAPLLREHRLYQADWLMRFYGFAAPKSSAGTTDNMLDQDIDPKLAWALRNRDRFPVDVNTADREMLLRIPGFGVRSVDRILRARMHTRLRLDDLKRLAGSIQRLRPFVITADHRRQVCWIRSDLAHCVDAAARNSCHYSDDLHRRDPPAGRSRRIPQRCAQTAGSRQCARRTWLDHRDDATLFAANPAAGRKAIGRPALLRDLAEAVVCHRDDGAGRCYIRRYGGSTRVNAGCMEQTADPLVHRLRQMAAAVRHDQHRMTAFVRFPQVRRDPERVD